MIDVYDDDDDFDARCKTSAQQSISPTRKYGTGIDTLLTGSKRLHGKLIEPIPRRFGHGRTLSRKYAQIMHGGTTAVDTSPKTDDVVVSRPQKEPPHLQPSDALLAMLYKIRKQKQALLASGELHFPAIREDTADAMHVIFKRVLAKQKAKRKSVKTKLLIDLNKSGIFPEPALLNEGSVAERMQACRQVQEFLNKRLIPEDLIRKAHTIIRTIKQDVQFKRKAVALEQKLQKAALLLDEGFLTSLAKGIVGAGSLQIAKQIGVNPHYAIAVARSLQTLRKRQNKKPAKPLRSIIPKTNIIGAHTKRTFAGRQLRQVPPNAILHKNIHGGATWLLPIKETYDSILCEKIEQRLVAKLERYYGGGIA
jgi:hypothetical protein